MDSRKKDIKFSKWILASDAMFSTTLGKVRVESATTRGSFSLVPITSRFLLTLHYLHFDDIVFTALARSRHKNVFRYFDTSVPHSVVYASLTRDMGKIQIRYCTLPTAENGLLYKPPPPPLSLSFKLPLERAKEEIRPGGPIELLQYMENEVGSS